MDHYATLGITADFTPAELRRAFRRATLRAHPDKHGGSDESFRAVGEAHAILSDQVRRRAWDSGEDLPRRPQPFGLREEVERHYFPELRGFRPFGDP
mmetsp:Transcript_40940/g.92730  ORF Transcript_40940/g.92730 Transcript_40940/m.92730 type:complete len:97 (+) Transcript_40940:515-805(+)